MYLQSADSVWWSHTCWLHKVQDFQKSFLEMMRADHQKDVLDVLSSGVINDDVTAIIEKVAADTAQPFKVNE